MRSAITSRFVLFQKARNVCAIRVRNDKGVVLTEDTVMGIEGEEFRAETAPMLTKAPSPLSSLALISSCLFGSAQVCVPYSVGLCHCSFVVWSDYFFVVAALFISARIIVSSQFV